MEHQYCSESPFNEPSTVTSTRYARRNLWKPLTRIFSFELFCKLASAWKRRVGGKRLPSSNPSNFFFVFILDEITDSWSVFSRLKANNFFFFSFFHPCCEGIKKWGCDEKYFSSVDRQSRFTSVCFHVSLHT